MVVIGTIELLRVEVSQMSHVIFGTGQFVSDCVRIFLLYLHI